jgi:hypothetical protein
MKTKILTDLTVDDPLVQNAGFEFDRNDRQYIDSQIRGVQQHLVDLLIAGRLGTYFTLDGASAAVLPGDTVCTSTASPGTVTKSTAAALANATAALGVVLKAAAPGGRVCVAFEGVVSPTITPRQQRRRAGRQRR